MNDAVYPLGSWYRMSFKLCSGSGACILFYTPNKIREENWYEVQNTTGVPYPVMF
jgi:hypothetical protein